MSGSAIQEDIICVAVDLRWLLIWDRGVWCVPPEVDTIILGEIQILQNVADSMIMYGIWAIAVLGAPRHCM